MQIRTLFSSSRTTMEASSPLHLYQRPIPPGVQNSSTCHCIRRISSFATQIRSFICFDGVFNSSILSLSRLPSRNLDFLENSFNFVQFYTARQSSY